MLLTERELATYEGIQQALDKDRQDQMLRLMLADWYEEQGREAAAECMRWLANRNMWPYGRCDWKYGWGWTHVENVHKELYCNHKLPKEVHRFLPEYKGGYYHNGSYSVWWEWCQTRQFAEEAAVMAWEKWWQVR